MEKFNIKSNRMKLNSTIRQRVFIKLYCPALRALQFILVFLDKKIQRIAKKQKIYIFDNKYD